MLRKILAVISGTAVGMLGIGAVESIGHSIYPVPAGMNMENKEAIEAYINTAPIGALLFIILAWLLGSFLAGLVSSLIAKRENSMPAIICGVLLMMFGISMLVMVPHPTWFWPLVAFAFVPPAWLGFKIVKK